MSDGRWRDGIRRPESATRSDRRRWWSSPRRGWCCRRERWAAMASSCARDAGWTSRRESGKNFSGNGDSFGSPIHGLSQWTPRLGRRLTPAPQRAAVASPARGDAVLVPTNRSRKRFTVEDPVSPTGAVRCVPPGNMGTGPWHPDANPPQTGRRKDIQFNTDGDEPLPGFLTHGP